VGSFTDFVRSRKFFLNLFIIAILITVLFFVGIRWLDRITGHGEFVVVPDFRNQKVRQLSEFTKDKQVMFQIIDSIYDPHGKPGIVLKQDPEPGSHVKHNRTVYLYVTGMVPPGVSMPKLLDRSERQARLILASYGLRAGKVSEVEADCNGCVISQSIRGKEVTPGASIKKGSIVDLVIGMKDKFGARDTTNNGTDPE
jgi:beta-lactam-binding protein with PASTA domain